MIDVNEADRVLEAHSISTATCDCPLEVAVGRVLREEIRADRHQPPYDRVTMDGFALSSEAVAAGLRRFRREGVQGAGQQPAELHAVDGCIEVMTGAVLPVGCDTVVRVEDTAVSGDLVALRPGTLLASRQHVHAKGSDAAPDDLLVASGTTISPAHVGIAAAVGVTTLRVAEVPSIAVVSTGDELVDVSSVPAPHQIRRSNLYALTAALHAHGFGRTLLCHIQDDRDALQRELEALLQRSDLLLLSGGVSMGKFDFVPSVLTSLGVVRHFHKVRQRPGKPLWFGTREGKAVFALPGNPVSSLTCLTRYVLPFLMRSLGGTASAPGRIRLSGETDGISGFTLFQAVALERGCARPVASNTSGDLVTLGRSDGFVQVEPDAGTVKSGSELPFFPWMRMSVPEGVRC